jgi:hypothetical protein
MKRLLSSFWEYLLNINWDDEDDVEVFAVKQGLGNLGGLLVLVIVYFFGYVAGTAAFLVFFMGCGWLQIEITSHQEEMREQALEEARLWKPPNVYGEREFGKDKRLGGDHL